MDARDGLNMRTDHRLVQGSDEWHKFRLEHFGASEAAAMLGLSKKVTRTELLHMKHTGTPKEFSEWVQKNILDYGHEVEALARPIIEEFFDIELYPVTCSDGLLSASCDGLTLCDKDSFEHKQWNEALAESVLQNILPEEHMPQCQQVLMITGAERLIFTVSDGTRENLVWMEVFPDREWFERIRAGWQQFEKDLAEYVPIAHPEKPEAQAVMQLPALTIQASGSISIISNLELFGKKLNEFVERLDLEPNDDQGFANADAAAKTLQKVETALEAAEQNALAQAAEVDEMRRTVELYREIARKTRLMLEKMVVARKKQIREDIISKATKAFSAHMKSLEEEIKPIKLVAQWPDFITAAKSKRTLKSLHDAVDTELANSKIAVDATAKEIRAKLAWYREHSKGYELLFPDLDRVIYKPSDDFQMLVQNRIAQHKMDEAKKLEAERLRIQAEEKAKMQAMQVKPVEADAPKAEPTKPTLIKSGDNIPTLSNTYALMFDLSVRDAIAFRNKYSGIVELEVVHAALDRFLAVNAPAEVRSGT